MSCCAITPTPIAKRIFPPGLPTTPTAWAHQQVLHFVQADANHYAAFFAGSGCTAPLNRLARTLAARRPERDVVLVSLLEHHANDLSLPQTRRNRHPYSAHLQRADFGRSRPGGAGTVAGTASRAGQLRGDLSGHAK
ncbi:MAG: hypothetical protein IPL99_15355, partial [Candidatus Competibacteraceae bacterium]|nr:hypothetical protein [Candidatus Competibacteraceae bacterium]